MSWKSTWLRSASGTTFWVQSMLLTCGLLLTGCAANADVPESHRTLTAVSGIVTLKGEPLAGAAISYIPVGDQGVEAAYGKTDAEGKYTLMTPIKGYTAKQSQGAIPGTYRVVISKLQMPDGSDVAADVSEADAQMMGAKEIVPQKYSHPQAAAFQAEVQENSPQEGVDFSIP